MLTRQVFSAVIAAVIIGCGVLGCSTDGNPVAKQPSGTTSAAPASPSTTAPTPPPPPPPPSDEQQIRDTIAGYQDAYNTENWPAYMTFMCPTMRERFAGSVLDTVRQTRASAGITTVTVSGVVVTGERASATMVGSNELVGVATIDVPLVRGDDGWTICMTYLPGRTERAAPWA